MTTTDIQRRNLRCVIKLAMPAIEALAPEQRADALDGISTACGSLEPDMARDAEKAAASLREALSAQLIFSRELFKGDGEGGE